MRESTAQRRERILSYIASSGHVMVKDLATALSFSESTVRRDLRALARDNNIKLFYGGASLVRLVDSSFRGRIIRNVEAKRVIGGLAATLVHDGDTIFIDSSTTSFQIIPHLKSRCNLTVVTHSARVALEFDVSSVKVIHIGGICRPGVLDNVGPMTIAAIEDMRNYIGFLGVDGLGMDFGASVFDPEAAYIASAVARTARKTVILADQTKFRQNSIHKFAAFDRISCIVTDQLPSSQWIDFCSERGVEILAPAGHSHKPAASSPDSKRRARQSSR